MKISRTERARHLKAEELLKLDRKLTVDEVEQVLATWHEGYAQDHVGLSAFFTPNDLAAHLSLEVPGNARVLDLCAGIGSLSFAVMNDMHPPRELVLVEKNEDYCRVARRLFPDAEVICGSIYDNGLMLELAMRDFDVVMSNPPFGQISKSAGDAGPRYKGDVHYEAIDIASDLAKAGVFILPQQACPFKFSGQQSYSEVGNSRYEAFSAKTGIKLECASSSVDTAVLSNFRLTKITTEIVWSDFCEARERRMPDQSDLFSEAA